MRLRVLVAILAISSAAGVAVTPPAQAKGCIRGAIAGGVAGHMVHHTVTGAVAGCLAARHYYKEKARQTQQPAQPRPQRDENPAAAY